MLVITEDSAPMLFLGIRVNHFIPYNLNLSFAGYIIEIFRRLCYNITCIIA